MGVDYTSIDFNVILASFFVSVAVPIRQPYQTRYKLPLMNWSVLGNQQLRNTIFVGMSDEVIEKLDMDRFERLFRLSPEAIATGGTGAGTANGKVTNGSVEAKTSNGLEIDTGASVTDGDSRPGTAANRRTPKVRLMDANRQR